MGKKQITSIFFMLLATFIWGTSFVVQTDSSGDIGPLSLMAIRSFVGAAALAIVIIVKRIYEKKKNIEYKYEKNIGKILKTGILCGLGIALATGLQQFGIYYNTIILGLESSGKAGFLTAMYIIFVPLFGFMVGRKSNKWVIIGSVLGFAGMYLLCVADSFSVSLGDILLIACALAFTLHILVIDTMSKNIDPLLLSLIQFFVAGVILAPIAILTENNMTIDWSKAWFSIIYLGVFSSAVAYTIQIVIQKNLHPAVASLIMSFESVFAAISGAIFLKELMSSRELLACGVLFAGIVIAQFGEYIFNYFKFKKVN